MAAPALHLAASCDFSRQPTPTRKLRSASLTECSICVPGLLGGQRNQIFYLYPTGFRKLCIHGIARKFQKQTSDLCSEDVVMNTVTAPTVQEAPGVGAWLQGD